ncbi:hypothetical protein AABB24_032650, partial [Solanum stoloniferum]
ITSLHIPKISEPIASHRKGKRLFIFPKNNSSRGKRLLRIAVQVNFEFDCAVGIKWVMHSLSDRWRAYKYKLRCDNFYPNKSKQEILANRPANVDSNDWVAFVHHYKEDKMKTQSAQNTKNRTKLKVSHAGGSKSNARRDRQMEQKLGRPVCRSEVVLSTLLKKNGNYVNEEGKILAVSFSWLIQLLKCVTPTSAC